MEAILFGKKCTLLERCGKCGAIFDLGYDFEDPEIIMSALPLKQLNFKRLCWVCRAK